MTYSKKPLNVIQQLSVAGACSLLLLCPALSIGGAFSGKSTLDAKTIHDTWEANYANITSMKMRVVQTQMAKNDNTRFIPYSYTERIEDGNCVFAFSSRDRESQRPFRTVSFNGKIGKSYMTGARAGGTIFDGPTGLGVQWWNPMKQCLRVMREDWDRVGIHPGTDPDKLEFFSKLKKKYPLGICGLTLKYELSRRQEDGLSVRPDLEIVSGEPCHVLELGSPGTRRSIYWFAHERSMLIMQRGIQEANGTEDISFQIREIAKANTDFGELWYPRKAETNSVNLKQEYTIKEFVPYVKTTPDMFDIIFPAGMRARAIDGVTSKSSAEILLYN